MVRLPARGAGKYNVVLNDVAPSKSGAALLHNFGLEIKGVAILHTWRPLVISLSNTIPDYASGKQYVDTNTAKFCMYLTANHVSMHSFMITSTFTYLKG